MPTRGLLAALLAALFVLSALAMALSDQILDHVLVVPPVPQEQLVLFGDETEGGTSEARLISAEQRHAQCLLRPTFAYPFCGFEVKLTPEPLKGLDLRSYHTLRLGLRYTGPSKTIRVLVLNAIAGYSKLGERESLKFNEIEFGVDQLRNHMVDIPLNALSVPPWWIKRRHVPPANSQTEFDNVVQIGINSGTVDPLGTHDFYIDKIEIIGQRISKETYYQAILGLWLVVGGLLMARWFWQMRQEVSRRKQREQELEAMNAILDRHSQALDQQRKTDPLTGLANRHGLEASLQRAFEEWEQHQEPVSLVIIDIDHFKRLNDTHGHLAGDAVLRGLSDVVRQHIREPQDFLARWGGEEFVVVCHGCKAPQAVALAEKIRKLIEESVFEGELRATASFGVAEIQPGQTLSTLFAAADAALYRAKGEGRNRVVFAGAGAGANTVPATV
ncbi:GGDEF domain-containing protein [Roseateles paludis]|uniref:diguanylate cyclase n=1 Tax=Roseateles paludis TaxID=3145238 RepID=A0ABV0G303_9BURK